MKFLSDVVNARILQELEKTRQYGREVGEAFLKSHEVIGKLLVILNGGLDAMDRKGGLALIDSLEDRYPGMNKNEYEFMASSIYLWCCCGLQSDVNGEDELDELPLVEVIDLVLFNDLDKTNLDETVLAALATSKIRH